MLLFLVFPYSRGVPGILLLDIRYRILVLGIPQDRIEGRILLLDIRYRILVLWIPHHRKLGRILNLSRIVGLIWGLIRWCLILNLTFDWILNWLLILLLPGLEIRGLLVALHPMFNK